jgi:hypothetical protein
MDGGPQTSGGRGTKTVEGVRDRGLKRGRGQGTGQTMEVTGAGQLPLDLLDEVLFEILARVPILELRNLLRQKVSRRFAAAIRSVFLEMASQAVRRACDVDEQGAVGDEPYKQAFKIRYIFMTPSNHDRGADQAYSARDCHRSDRPLSQEDPLGMHVDSPWPC